VSCFGFSEVNQESVLRHWLTENVSTVHCSSLLDPAFFYLGRPAFKMDTPEVTIAEFSEFADAVGLLTNAEKE